MPDSHTVAAVPEILRRLHAAHPDARYELNWDTPLQLLVATILAAQCTDERVNEVTPTLFAKYPDAKSYADADMAELEEDLRPTGFYRQKASTVQQVCRKLVEDFEGEVPDSMEEMVTLPGVARKTANVVLNSAFRKPTGVIVDTHVQRVSQRLGLTTQRRPEKIELDLMQLVPQDEWIFFGPATVLHGRYTCTHHAPHCPECILNDQCPKVGVETDAESPVSEETAEEQHLDFEEESPMAAKKATKTKSTRARKAKPAATAKMKSEANVPSLPSRIPLDWQEVLADEFQKPYFRQLEEFVAEERKVHTVYPPEPDVFNALKATPFEKVKVVLLGQDPYHGEGEAHGMCFSVRPGMRLPPSLVNIFKEMQQDLGIKPPSHGYLAAWAHRGVLLLNAVLTVRADEPNSHKDRGWESFTDAVIQVLNKRRKSVVFLLWGAYAQKKGQLIDTKSHRVLTSAHPSPLSAKKFFASRPFSCANRALEELGEEPIDWQLPDQPNGTPASSHAKPTVAPSPSQVDPPPQAAALAVAKEPPTLLEAMLPEDWRTALLAQLRKPSFRALDKFLAEERKTQRVLPPPEDVFNAFKFTPLARVRVVLLGQEPSAEVGEADGLSFSVKPGVGAPPGLTAMFEELRNDLGCRIPVTGSLVPWARQGVLLLNSILTVRAGNPGSQKDKGWEPFTDAVLKLVNARPTPIIFALWGSQAQRKQHLIDEDRHVVLTADNPLVHPDRFLDSEAFSAINTALELRGQSAVYWQLPYV
jgi:uracil-DNA glycosylase/endonuclease III